MTIKPTQPWVPIEKIEPFIQIEPAFVTLGLAFGAWAISRIFLRKLSGGRKRNLHLLFRNLAFNLLFGALLFATFYILQQLNYEKTIIERFMTYIGLATILVGAISFVKVWRILVLEYLFLSHMNAGFPVLLVNLFTLLLSIILGGWICAEIFNVRLAPILATSAIFSLVLGLALQDTLGNLFAGIALQFDKPYEIGDWVEIQTNGQKWVGQVSEITWRATVLLGFAEEAITVPNRIMGQSEISNFATKHRPIIRSQVYRLALEVNIPHVKELLTHSAREVYGIRKNPYPFVLISETTESWVSFKLVYFIENYGDQFLIADRIFSKALPALQEAGYELAGHTVRVHPSGS